MMGMVEGVFDTLPIEDMPAGYTELRTNIKLLGMSIRERKEIIKQKMEVYSGIQNVSIDNINKNNQIRFELYREFLKMGFPYMKIETTKIESNKGTVEDLVAEYKRIFPQQATK